MATTVNPGPTDSGWYPDPAGIPPGWQAPPPGWSPQQPPAPAPPRRPVLGRPVLIAAVAVLVVLGIGLQLTLFSGPITLITGRGTVAPVSETGTTDGPAGTTVAPTGEIWQQVLGQPIDSPVVQSWGRSCGMTLPKSRNLCHESGWELMLDPALMQVERVFLYGVVDSAIQRYQGALPYGLTWDASVDDVLQAWGQPVTVMGGNGTAIQLHYQGSDGNTVVLHLTALHQDPAQIAGAAIHHVEIFRT